MYPCTNMGSFLQNSFMTTNDYSVSNIWHAYRNACRSSQNVLLFAHFNQNQKVNIILVNPQHRILWKSLQNLSRSYLHTDSVKPTNTFFKVQFWLFITPTRNILPFTITFKWVHGRTFHWNICSKPIYTLWFHKACKIMCNYRNHISSHNH